MSMRINAKRNISLVSQKFKLVLASRQCIRFCVLFQLLPLHWHSLEQRLVSPSLRERFKARRARTEQVLSSPFHLLCHLLEDSDGRHHKHTTGLSRRVAITPRRKVLNAFSLELSLPNPGYNPKTGTYDSPS
jgi:hypothetical protein